MGTRLVTILLVVGLGVVGAEAYGVMAYGMPALGMGGTQARALPKIAPFEVDRSDKPTFPLTGTITGLGLPLADAIITTDGQTTMSDADGAFAFDEIPLGPVTIEGPGYLPQTFDFDGVTLTVDVALDARIVRAMRVSPGVAGDDADFQHLLDLAATTSVNALVFDTKGDHEGGLVYYDTQVPAAKDAGLVDLTYDATQRLQQAHDAGLYTITRIPTFLDPAYADAHPEHVIAGDWLDPADRAYWEYPISLAVEACELGFDEIQFDYVRYPSGTAATQARSKGKVPDEATRIANVKGYLEAARDALHPLGCAVSADIFGIVNAIENDQGIGQYVEEVSQPLDAYSAMIYPEQWGAGWFGLDQPSNHPGELVAAVLDKAIPRVAPGTIVRPWIQSYYYSGDKILAQIASAEARGLGWMLWNSPGNYSTSGLPPGGPDD